MPYGDSGLQRLRVLITGMRGAAGSYLAEHLATRRMEIHGAMRPECDLTSFDAILRRIREVTPDVVYHLASKANVRASFDIPGAMFDNNTAATINLFEAIRAAGIDPVIVVCSSSEVYGNPDSWPIAETAPMSPVNPYAASKAATDLLAQMYASCYGMRVVITRAFGYVNPRRRDLSLSSFARQIALIERGEQSELVHGNLDSVRTFCDVRDIVEAYALAAELPVARAGGKVRAEAYNIGSEAPVSIGECLEILFGMAAVKVRTRINPSLLRPRDMTNQVPDCAKFRAATGWRPKIELEASLAWLLDRCRAQVGSPALEQIP